MPVIHTSGAYLSDDGVYRYCLWRGWEQPRQWQRVVNFVMLNPSTADAEKNDPTIRKCIAFAEKWGFNRLVVTNLYAYRTSKPEKLLEAHAAGADVVGPENADWLYESFHRAHRIVAAWGNHGNDVGLAQDQAVFDTLWTAHSSKLYVLGWTNMQQPLHPLWVDLEREPLPYALSR